MKLRHALCALAFTSFVGGPAALADQTSDAIKNIKKTDYPSANTVAVVADQNVVFQKDGSFTNTQHSVRVVLTQAGKAEAATASLNYAKDAETMEVTTAQVIKKDGRIVKVPASDIKDTEQSGDMNIYDPNGRSVKVTFAGLDVGDAVELTAKMTRKLPTRANYWNDIFAFQSTEPMIGATYTVDGPSSMPLTAEVYHADRGAKIASTKTTTGDRTVYTWHVDKAPQLVPEIAMDMMNEVPLLVVTTDPSWQHFSKWWADLTAGQMDMTPELKAKVAELVKDAKTDQDKIKAMYDFVSSDIRYRGLGVGPRTGYTPRKASETYTSRWGVCRDVSILLTTMLRSQGFEAYPVLTNVGEPVLPKVAYDGFNHAIVAMPNKSGGWTYLDPTAKNSSELIPGQEAEQTTLVSTTKGEPLTAIPALPPGANLGHAVAKSKVNDDGSMSSTVTLETKGMFDMVVRGVAATTSPDQQKEVIEQVLHASLPDAKLKKVEISPALALWQPMTVTLEIDVPKAAVSAGNVRMLRTLVTSGALGLVENVLPQVLGGQPERKFTLDAQLTFQYDEDETVELPKNTRIVALPNETKIQNRASALDATCSQKDGILSCHRSFQLKSRFVEPQQYDKLKELLAQLGTIARQPVILGGDS